METKKLALMLCCWVSASCVIFVSSIDSTTCDERNSGAIKEIDARYITGGKERCTCGWQAKPFMDVSDHKYDWDCKLLGCTDEDEDDFIAPGQKKIRGDEICECVKGNHPWLADDYTLYYLQCLKN